MRLLADYRDEMPLSNLSDQEIEQILSGERLRRSDVGDLEAFVHALAATAILERPPGDVAGSLAETARLSRPEMEPSSWSRAALLVATLGLVVTLGGVAVAADAAVPGDLMYPLDRALETIGIGVSGVEERISELDILVDRGDHEGARGLLQELAEPGKGEDSARAARDLDGASVNTPAGMTPNGVVNGSDDPANEATPSTPDTATGANTSNGSGGGGNDHQPDHAGLPGQGNPQPRDPGSGSSSGNSGQGNGNQGNGNQGNTSTSQGNQESPPVQGNGNQGNGNHANQGSPPAHGNQGNGDQDTGNQGNDSTGQGNQGSPPAHSNQGNASPNQDQGNPNQVKP
jgi:hypothetical protein